MTDVVAGALVDGEPGAAVPLDDRGLAYGDGVFETLLLDGDRPVWWDAHLQRLEHGAAVLGIVAPPRGRWLDDLHRLLHLARPAPRRVLKLILTRGSGARGYRVDPSAASRRIVCLLPPPRRLLRDRDGIRLRWCDIRLAAQPRLAGIKHLNRLEQVLARAEWSDPAIDEGLLLDSDGSVISATAANLFVIRDGRLQTSSLEQCGIAGTCRAFLLSSAEQVRLGVDDVLGADELFVCNSLRGILPVTRLDDRRWPVGPHTRGLQARLAAAEPALADESPA